MTASFSNDDVATYRTLVSEQLGLDLQPEHDGLLRESLHSRLDDLQLGSFAELHARWLSPGSRAEEVKSVASLLTVGETYFFRYPEQFNALADVALPTCWGLRPHLRVLSVGCSSGEEPFSMAMVIAEKMAQQPGIFADILGVDVNVQVLAKARQARYTAWSFRERPTLAHSAWVVQDGRDYALNDSLRAMVQFELHNLADPDEAFWQAGQYDVVFCRNLLIYFSPDALNKALKRLASVVRPGGFLFLGHAENLRGQAAHFRLHQSHGTFFYQAPDQGAGGQSARGGLRAEPAEAATLSPHAAKRAGQASRRLAAVAAAAPTLGQAAATVGADSTKTFDEAMQLFLQERFAEALQRLESLPDRAHNMRALLLRAAILTNRAALSEAEAACQEILQHDSLHSGAYYLLSVCREQAGDGPGAIQAAERSAHLDSRFAMPLLALGRLWRKSGDMGRARRALQMAETLLLNEDVSRLSLFAGGFARDALLGLCRRERAACGDKP